MNICEYTGVLLLAMQNLFLFKKGYAMSQQIYLPLGGRYPIPYEFDADTMQVPRGAGGPLERCFDGDGNFKKGKGNPNA